MNAHGGTQKDNKQQGQDLMSLKSEVSLTLQGKSALTGDCVDCFSGSDSDEQEEPEPKEVASPNRSKIKKFPGQTTMPSTSEMRAEMLDEIGNSFRTKECNLSKLVPVIPRELFEAVPHLHTLCLSENELSHINGEMFLHAIQLRKLDLSNNKLQNVPSEIFSLPNLDTLLLDHNELSQLPTFDVLRDGKPLLPLATKIGLEWNNLGNFPTEFIFYCSRLETLFLGENENLFSHSIPTVADLERAAPNRLPGLKLMIKIDNRPRVIEHMKKENWTERLPWLTVELNKIYPDKVSDFIFLGSMRTAQCETVYRDLNIGYILTAGRGLDVKVSPGMKHLVLTVDDLPGEDMSPLFADAFRFIEEARCSGRGILIHCFAGLSRSVTLTVGYLMWTRYPMTRDQALACVRQSRPAAQPNAGFMDCLLRYEKQLIAEQGARR